MKIRFGYELVYAVPQPVPKVFLLHAQPGTDQIVVVPDAMRVQPAVPLTHYVDAFGNTWVVPAPPR